MDIIGEAAYRIRADTSGFQKEAEGGIFPAVKKIGGILAAAFAVEKTFEFGKEAVKEAALTQKAIEGVRASFGRNAALVIDFNEKEAASFGVSNAAASKFAAQVGLLTDNLGINNQESAVMTLNLEKLGANIANIKGVDAAEVFDTLAASLGGATRGLKQYGIVLSTDAIQQEAVRLGLIKTVDEGLTPAQKAQAIYNLEMKRFEPIAKQAEKNQDDLANVSKRLGAEFDNLKERIGVALLPFIERVAIVIEQRVIPFISEWVDKITNFLTPAIEAATGFIEDHADAILDVSKAFITASGAAITLGSAFEAISLGAELLASPLAIVLALGTGVVLAYQKVQVFHKIVDSAFNAIADAAGNLGAAVSDALGTIGDAFAAAGRHEKFSVQIRIIWRGIEDAVSELWDAFTKAWDDRPGASRNPLLIRGKDIQFEKQKPGQDGLGSQIKDAVREGIKAGFADLGEINAHIDWGEVFDVSTWNDIFSGIGLPTDEQIGQWLNTLPGRAARGIADLDWGAVFNPDTWNNIFDGIGLPTDEEIGGWLNSVAERFAFGTDNIDWGGLPGRIWDSLSSAISDFFSGGGEGGGSRSGGGLLTIDLSSLVNIDFGGIAGKINDALGGIPGQVAGIFTRLVSSATGILSDLAGQVGGLMTNVATNVAGGLAGLPGRVAGIFSGIASNALGILRGLIGSAGTAASSIAGRIVSAFTGLPGRVGATLASVGSTIVGKLNGVVTSAFAAARSIGASIVQGVISGISGLAGEVASAVGNMVTSAIDHGKSLLHINSPSLVFANEIGAPISEGIAHGILRSAGLVNDALGTVITPPSMATVRGAASSASATVGKAVTVVHVHFDDPTLKGLINVQIDNADQQLANQIAAGTR